MIFVKPRRLPHVRICFLMKMATLYSIKPTASLTNLQLSQAQLLGLAHIVENYGSMTLAEVLEPAIRLARDGIEVTYDLAADLARSQRLKLNPASLRKFYKPDGSNYEVGELWKQPDLAWTLSEIAEHGVEAFYSGSVAKKIVADMEAHNGLITMQDLADYKVVEREPVRGSFRGYEIAAMPAPSSGGTHVIQMLNITGEFPARKNGPRKRRYTAHHG